MANSSETRKSVSAAPTETRSRREREVNEEEATSPAQRRRLNDYHLREVIFRNNVPAFDTFKNEFDEKMLLKGRIFDAEVFGGGNLDVCRWIHFQGWTEYMRCRDACYPRMVKILLCNYDSKTKKSWVGDKEIDLSPEAIRSHLALPTVETCEPEFPRSRGQLFSECVGTEIGDDVSHLHPSHLDVNLRIAHKLVISNIYPKRGGKDNISEKDAGILWAMKHGKKVDLAQTMSEHLRQVRSNKRFPLPYGRILSKILMIGGIDLSSEDAEEVNKSDEISEAVFKRSVGTRRKASKRAAAEGTRQENIREERQAAEGRSEPERPVLVEEIRQEADNIREEGQAAEGAAFPSPIRPSVSSLANFWSRLRDIGASVSALHAKVAQVCGKVDHLDSLVESIRGESRPAGGSSPSSPVHDQRSASPLRSHHSPHSPSPVSSPVPEARPASPVRPTHSPDAPSSPQRIPSPPSVSPPATTSQVASHPLPTAQPAIQSLLPVRPTPPPSKYPKGMLLHPSEIGPWPKDLSKFVAKTEHDFFRQSEKSYKLPPMQVVTFKIGPNLSLPGPRMLSRKQRITTEEIENRKRINELADATLAANKAIYTPFDLPFPHYDDPQFIELNCTIMEKPYPKNFKPKLHNIEDFVMKFMDNWKPPSPSVPPLEIVYDPTAQIKIPKQEAQNFIPVTDTANPLYHYLTEAMYHERVRENADVVGGRSPPPWPWPKLGNFGWRERLRVLVSAKDYPHARSSLPKGKRTQRPRPRPSSKLSHLLR